MFLSTDCCRLEGQVLKCVFLWHNGILQVVAYSVHKVETVNSHTTKVLFVVLFEKKGQMANMLNGHKARDSGC